MMVRRFARPYAKTIIEVAGSAEKANVVRGELMRFEAALKSVVGALQNGQEVEIRGFGSFRFRNRAPRKGRNPKTGEKVDVPPKKIPYFKMGKELKALLNGGVPAEPAAAAENPAPES